MDNHHLPAAAARFQLKDPDLCRVVTASGYQYLAGYVDRRDWQGVPVGATVFIRTGYEGQLLAGCVVANTLPASGHVVAREEDGLTLQLALPDDSPAEFFAARRVTTLLLALEQLEVPGAL